MLHKNILQLMYYQKELSVKEITIMNVFVDCRKHLDLNFFQPQHFKFRFFYVIDPRFFPQLFSIALHLHDLVYLVSFGLNSRPPCTNPSAPFIFQTSDVRTERKRHSTASKGPSGQTKYSINNLRRRSHDSPLTAAATKPSSVTSELGPPQRNNRRYQNIAWVRGGKHPVAAKQSSQHSSIKSVDPERIVPKSLTDTQRLPRNMTQQQQQTTHMSVRPIYNPSVYRINRIKPANSTTSTSQTTIDKNVPNPQGQDATVDPTSQTLGKYKWLSS